MCGAGWVWQQVEWVGALDVGEVCGAGWVWQQAECEEVRARGVEVEVGAAKAQVVEVEGIGAVLHPIVPARKPQQALDGWIVELGGDERGVALDAAEADGRVGVEQGIQPGPQVVVRASQARPQHGVERSRRDVQTLVSNALIGEGAGKGAAHVQANRGGGKQVRRAQAKAQRVEPPPPARSPLAQGGDEAARQGQGIERIDDEDGTKGDRVLAERTE